LILYYSNYVTEINFEPVKMTIRTELNFLLVSFSFAYAIFERYSTELILK